MNDMRHADYTRYAGAKASPAHEEMRTKYSVGIACFAQIDGKLKVLLGSKRFSYAFNEFAMGKYSNDKAELLEKFNNMYLEDKLVILTLSFDFIWYRIWLNFDRTSSYFVAKNKFESTFMLDGGQALQRMIQSSTNRTRIWEVPKGRKKSKTEADINCAVREFQEETGADLRSYKLYVDVKRMGSITDNGTTYYSTIFPAFSKTPIQPVVDLRHKEQLDEISELRWVDIGELRLIDEGKKLETLLLPLFRFIKNRLRE